MDKRTVYVSHEKTERSTPALSEPAFLIEHEGKLYLTKAVWEYHPGRDQAPAGEARGTAEAHRFFQEHVRHRPLRGIHVPREQQPVAMWESGGPPKD